MKRNVCFILLALAAIFPMMAYEYVFDMNALAHESYTLDEATPSGINIYIHVDGNVSPYLYTWDGNNELNGGWPGSTTTGLVGITKVGNDADKKDYFHFHYDIANLSAGALNFVVNNGNGSQTSDQRVEGAGNYFYDYDGTTGITDVTAQYVEEGDRAVPEGGTNIFVRVLSDDNVNFNDNANPFVYTWKGTTMLGGAWPGAQMTGILFVNGIKWFYWHTDNTDWSGGGAVISGSGSQTQNIDGNDGHPGLISGDNFFYYYPNGDGWKYSPQDANSFKNFIPYNHTNNFKVWDKVVKTIDGNKVSYTESNEYGSVTMTLELPGGSDPNTAISFTDNLMRVPANTVLKFKSNDGFNLREIYVGKVEASNQGPFPGENFVQAGLQMGDLADWLGVFSGNSWEHLFLSTKGNNFSGTEFSTPLFSERTGLGLGRNGKITVWTEGTSLEDLTHAHYNVRIQKHAIAHDLVGVAVKTINGKQYLVARSEDYIENTAYQNPMQPGQKMLTDNNGNVYTWSNPATKQYSWIILDINNPEQYLDKRIRGVRGLYSECRYELEYALWLTPTMKVEGTPTIIGDETTILNTYTLANMVEHDGDTYYLMEPQLAEICDIVDIMRTNDQILDVPDNTAIMAQDANGQQRENIYVNYGLDHGYASLFQPWDYMWEKANQILVDEGHPGETWRLKNKVYDCPGALVMASEHSAGGLDGEGTYVYPLDYPDQTYTMTTTGMVLHIIGEAEMQTYEGDMVVGNGEYWSRYNYELNKNAYRNDLSIAVFNPAVNVQNIGDMIIQRCDNNGNVLAEIGTITQGRIDWNQGGNYTVKYNDVAKEAKDDPALLEIAQTKPVYQEKTYDLQWGHQQGVLTMGLSDQFYSPEMTCKETNAALYPGYQYRVVPTEDNPNQNLTCVVSFAPVYKTSENVATRATYTQEQVDADTNHKLGSSDNVYVNFTPNPAAMITQYRVLSNLKKDNNNFEYQSDASLLEVGANSFLTQPVEVDGMANDFVSVAYTTYNDNTYGCYKQNVSDASIYATNYSKQASELITNEGYQYFNAKIRLESILEEVEKDARYLIRVWRVVGEQMTLLNGNSFDEEHVIEMNPDWETNYEDLALSNVPADDKKWTLTISDTFKWLVNSSKPDSDDSSVLDATYLLSLYVKDRDTENYYVKQYEVPVTWDSSVVTGLNNISVAKAISHVRYVNALGQVSNEPHNGVNIEIVTYSDGTTTSRKIIK